MTTTQISDDSTKKQINTIVNEYDEDEEFDYDSEEWWKANFDYLPIHFFKKMMTRNCFELAEKDLSIRKVIDIINNVVDNITPTMIQECNTEYIHSYHDYNYKKIITTGYINILKEYLSKLIRIYLTPTFYGNQIIYNHIKDTFYKFFSKERYWKDEELDDLEKIINVLPHGMED